MDYWAGAQITDFSITGTRVPHWERILTPYKGKVSRVLEVGAYEGQSALFWHKFFDAEVYSIDNWVNAEQPPTPRGVQAAEEAEARFDANIAGLPIHKLKGYSTGGLHYLGMCTGLFDLIYIDGDHSRDQVMIDSCLAWRVLRYNGVMIWDDWRSYNPGAPDELRPERAIELFLQLQGGNNHRIIDDTGQQLFVVKENR